MTRQEANRELVDILSELVEKHPDMRFGQLLSYAEVVKTKLLEPGDWRNEFNLESDKLLERVVIRLERE